MECYAVIVNIIALVTQNTYLKIVVEIRKRVIISGTGLVSLIPGAHIVTKWIIHAHPLIFKLVMSYVFITNSST